MTLRRTSAIAIVSLVLVALAVAAAKSRWGAGVRADLEAARVSDNQRCSTIDAFRGLRLSRAVAERTAQLEEQISYVGPDGEGLFLFATPHGDVWMPQAGDKHSLAVVLAEQEQSIYGTSGGSGVHPGDVVIDAGAHVGLFTRTALQAGASRVITFEVTPNANRALRRNVSDEIAAGQVTVVEAGVWHEEAVLPLVIVENCSICNSVTHKLPASIDVPLTTIDRSCASLA
jgi:FkbM family methyltransferase